MRYNAYGRGNIPHPTPWRDGSNVSKCHITSLQRTAIHIHRRHISRLMHPITTNAKRATRNWPIECNHNKLHVHQSTCFKSLTCVPAMHRMQLEPRMVPRSFPRGCHIHIYTHVRGNRSTHITTMHPERIHPIILRSTYTKATSTPGDPLHHGNTGHAAYLIIHPEVLQHPPRRIHKPTTPLHTQLTIRSQLNFRYPSIRIFVHSNKHASGDNESPTMDPTTSR